MPEPSEYDAVVPLEKMPPCPICGKPLTLPCENGDSPMFFIAHGRFAAAHDHCRVERNPDLNRG